MEAGDRSGGEEPEPEAAQPAPEAAQPAPASEAHPAHETSTRIAVLLAVAAVLAAAIGARGAALADEGSDKWHEAVRADIKYGAGLLEDTRYIYQEVAPQAFQVVSATIQAEELTKQARLSPSVRALLEGQAGAQSTLVASIAKATGVAQPKYLRPGPSYDVARRLADERNKRPDLVHLDAGEIEHEGSQLKKESSDLFGTAIPAAFAFLCGALAHGWTRWRRWIVPLGFGLCALSLILAIVVEISF
ncbi:MAG TPA: hypothetical protein VHR88_07740 [Solirubrobacteraceae bacterium]|nr:hypothetical protein [Solirubrobacteraceae bacterium]